MIRKPVRPEEDWCVGIDAALADARLRGQTYYPEPKERTPQLLTDHFLLGPADVGFFYLWDEAFYSNPVDYVHLNEILETLQLAALEEQSQLLVEVSDMQYSEFVHFLDLLALAMWFGWQIGVWNSSGSIVFAYDHHGQAFGSKRPSE